MFENYKFIYVKERYCAIREKLVVGDEHEGSGWLKIVPIKHLAVNSLG
jgi:hypothetical protein